MKEHSSANFLKYKLSRNYASKQVCQVKRYFFAKGAHSRCRSFWKLIKRYCKLFYFPSRPFQYPVGFGKLKVFVHPWSDANTVAALHSANKLNNYFIETINNLKCKFQSATSPYKLQCSRSSSAAKPIFRSITPADTIEAIYSLFNSASSGNDGITVCMMKMSAKVPALFNALTDVFHTSIINYIFPSAWKVALTTAVHKGGDVYEMNNYRPISLLPILSEIFDKIINKQVTDYLGCHRFLRDA